jgi:hypothetical protein
MKNYALVAFFFLFCVNSESICPEYSYQQGEKSCVSCNNVSGYRLRCLAWNRSTCESCPLGKYSTMNGTIRTCAACPLGTFSGTLGSALCTPCPDFTYADVTGSTICLPCQMCNLAGKYRSGCNATSSGTCSPCTKRV